MEAKAILLDTVLRKPCQWVVPVYQRHYEWETKKNEQQILKLWDDLKYKAIEKLDKQSPHPHYFGAIICHELRNQGYFSSEVKQLLLVDGQQRITSFQLVIAAIREVAREYVPQKLGKINAFLYNEVSPDMDKSDRGCFKLWPSHFDQDLYKSIVEGPQDQLKFLQPQSFYMNGNLKWNEAPKLLCAFWYLYEEMEGFIRERTEDGEPVEQVIDALLGSFLRGFRIVVIELDQGDSAQKIFASLNGLGKPLSPFDLIRNDIFYHAQKDDGEDADKLFEEQWQSFEKPFWNKQIRQGRLKRARADHLIPHVVVAETAKEVDVGKVATEYQHYIQGRFKTVSEELGILLKHADTYRAMEKQDALFAGITNVFRAWDMSTFHPLVLWISAQQIEDEDKAKFFELLESYIVRREICGLTIKNYNKVVTSIIRYIREEPDPVSAFSRCLSDPEHLTGDASRMPTDLEVVEQFTHRHVYGIYGNTPTPRLRYILLQIEHAMRTKLNEKVSVSAEDLTIEHVMPQRWAENWPLANGQTAPCEFAWEAINSGHTLDEKTIALMQTRGEVVGTFGNLTLLTNSLNPSIGNEGWEIKRTQLRDHSSLVMNREIANKEQWDEKSIKARSADLAKVANEIWKSPVD